MKGITGVIKTSDPLGVLCSKFEAFGLVWGTKRSRLSWVQVNVVLPFLKSYVVNWNCADVEIV